MPILKPISGHTGLAKAREYLEHGGRALAHDFLNLDAPEVASDGALPTYGEFDWASTMDETRTEFGNDAAWGDRRARTYKHYIVSPDPRDAASLSALRSVTMSWVRECFPEHEVAIVYHDDNEGHVLHAHVIVNNTNLETGGRLRDPDPRELKRRLQRISAEHGLSRLPDEDTGPFRRRNVGRTERELAEKGEYSWVADVRVRVAVARSVARSEGDFVAAMGRMGVVVEPSRSRKGDWVYSLAETPTRRVTGARLGADYTRREVTAWLSSPTRARPNSLTVANVMRLADGAIELRDLGELARLSEAVDVISRGGFRSLSAMDAAVNRMRGVPGCEASTAKVERARAYCAEEGILPEKATRTTGPRRQTRDDEGRNAHRKGMRQADNERVRQRRHQEPRRERRDL